MTLRVAHTAADVVPFLHKTVLARQPGKTAILQVGKRRTAGRQCAPRAQQIETCSGVQTPSSPPADDASRRCVRQSSRACSKVVKAEFYAAIAERSHRGRLSYRGRRSRSGAICLRDTARVIRSPTASPCCATVGVHSSTASRTAWQYNLIQPRGSLRLALGIMITGIVWVPSRA